MLQLIMKQCGQIVITAIYAIHTEFRTIDYTLIYSIFAPDKFYNIY